MSQGIQIIEHGDVVELKLHFNDLNTMNSDAFLALAKHLEELRQNKEPSVMLLTSGAPGFFCNGLDPAIMVDQHHKDVHRTVDILMRSTQALFQFPIPVVCVINGNCVGAGAIFALFSDYRFMNSEKGRIGFPEANIGMNFPAAGAKILVDAVGMNTARDMLYQGKMVKPDQAKQAGLVDEIFPAKDLFDKSLAFAQKLAQTPRPALVGLKKGLRLPYEEMFSKMELTDRDSTIRTIETKEAQEGFRSVLERRRPDFEQFKKG
ncbi:MAG: enoyl-CoA hydratase/isomerase family protein [Leptospiraceae bacterium]|nr:enoyl-CoA hydratase/isomerase family protein [Leptospiraceae bacterium]